MLGIAGDSLGTYYLRMKLLGAHEGSSKLNPPLVTEIGSPVRSPRRFTGWAVATFMPSGSVTVMSPPLPACSHTRNTIPSPSGLGQNAVTRTPFRDSTSPLAAAGRGLPTSPLFFCPCRTCRSFRFSTCSTCSTWIIFLLSANAATAGWRISHAGVKIACSSSAPSATG